MTANDTPKLEVQRCAALGGAGVGTVDDGDGEPDAATDGVGLFADDTDCCVAGVGAGVGAALYSTLAFTDWTATEPAATLWMSSSFCKAALTAGLCKFSSLSRTSVAV